MVSASGQLACGNTMPRNKSGRIQQVENGYLVNADFGGGTLIANTLPEAIELLRKIME